MGSHPHRQCLNCKKNASFLINRVLDLQYLMVMKSSVLLENLSAAISDLPASERTGLLKKVNGIFELHISAGSDSTVWSLEFKTTGEVKKGPSAVKPDAVLTLADDVFVDMVDGKLNGQKAFMGGKLKIKGNMMLATKLDIILKIKPQKKDLKAESSSASIDVRGFKASNVFVQIAATLLTASDTEKQNFIKSGNAIFQFDIKVNSMADNC